MDLGSYRTAFNGIGWFIPPYLQMRFLAQLATVIARGGSFTDPAFEALLSFAYSPVHLAAMITHRYPVTPCVADFKDIIREAAEAHFLGLDHVAVSGILPVIEGVADRLTASRGLTKQRHVKKKFSLLLADCKSEIITKQIGAIDELVTMLDAFQAFIDRTLYENTSDFSGTDGTNRHGTLHGIFADGDYGRPLNFYKALSAVDFLCMLSALRANVSWLAPSPDEKSKPLANHFALCVALARRRPT